MSDDFSKSSLRETEDFSERTPRMLANSLKSVKLTKECLETFQRIPKDPWKIAGVLKESSLKLSKDCKSLRIHKRLSEKSRRDPHGENLGLLEELKRAFRKKVGLFGQSMRNDQKSSKKGPKKAKKACIVAAGLLGSRIGLIRAYQNERGGLMSLV